MAVCQLRHGLRIDIMMASDLTTTESSAFMDLFTVLCQVLQTSSSFSAKNWRKKDVYVNQRALGAFWWSFKASPHHVAF